MHVLRTNQSIATIGDKERTLATGVFRGQILRQGDGSSSPETQHNPYSSCPGKDSELARYDQDFEY
jgi:hypothetical protein